MIEGWSKGHIKGQKYETIDRNGEKRKTLVPFGSRKVKSLVSLPVPDMMAIMKDITNGKIDQKDIIPLCSSRARVTKTTAAKTREPAVEREKNEQAENEQNRANLDRRVTGELEVDQSSFAEDMDMEDDPSVFIEKEHASISQELQSTFIDGNKRRRPRHDLEISHVLPTKSLRLQASKS
ncbi:uncharacterized protein LOC141914662 [Tubulanus polymorphus]|uniref:uncharacterized protein LOC141910024 n=1 Tax=Tubulanus polymorphus TaxID=672921 RepID=UPI003DA62552